MYILIITLPLFSIIYFLFFGNRIGIKGLKWITNIINIMMVIINISIIKEMIQNNIKIKINIFKYIFTSEIMVKWELYYDFYSIMMINIIIIISMIVENFSFWYLGEDKHFFRFLFYLLGFKTMMLFFVISSNFLTMFIGWEGIGIFSFLLISFYNNRVEAIKAGLKAMNYNRIGDIGFILIILMYFKYWKGYTIFNVIFTNVSFLSSFDSFFFFFFFLACFIKSAQFFFQPWLASSMEGPTPVSALLHAATMVTAGIYLFIRIPSLLWRG